MKTTLLSLAVLSVVSSGFAGQTVVTSHKTCLPYEPGRCSAHVRCCSGLKDAGTPGAFYESNLARNAVILVNDTPCFMTFFVYFGDCCALNDINAMISEGAQVYETVVAPYSRTYTNQRGRHYWVGTKSGKWGIDLAKNKVAPLPY